MKQREISYALVERAAAAGFDTLFFTVDTPVAGARLRDKRNGFSIPPQLSVSTIVDALPRPWWWWDFLTTPKLEFASLSATGGTVGELLNAAMDRRSRSTTSPRSAPCGPGKLVIKGVQNVEDSGDWPTSASTASSCPTTAGASSTVHRRAVPPAAEVVREVGADTEIAIDTGIMNGADIVASLASARSSRSSGGRISTASCRRAPGRRPGDRDPRRPGRAHDAAAAGDLARRADPRPRHAAGASGPRPRAATAAAHGPDTAPAGCDRGGRARPVGSPSDRSRGGRGYIRWRTTSKGIPAGMEA